MIFVNDEFITYEDIDDLPNAIQCEINRALDDYMFEIEFTGHNDKYVVFDWVASSDVYGEIYQELLEEGYDDDEASGLAINSDRYFDTRDDTLSEINNNYNFGNLKAVFLFTHIFEDD